MFPCVLILTLETEEARYYASILYLNFFFILQLKDEHLLSNTWIDDDDLKSVISSATTNIPMLFNESEVQERTPKCQRILQSANRYNNE